MADVSFLPGATDALFHAGQQGWQIYLFGNEDQVPDGRQSLEDWLAIDAGILEHLRSHGVQITRSYAATERPDGVPPYDKESVYALPNTGVMHHARQEDGIDLDESWVVANDVLSLVAGWRAGCHTAGVATPRIMQAGNLSVEPELIGLDLGHTLASMGARPPIRRSA
jgi:histidinol phosphatase-like enzyme